MRNRYPQWGSKGVCTTIGLQYTKAEKSSPMVEFWRLKRLSPIGARPIFRFMVQARDTEWARMEKKLSTHVCYWWFALGLQLLILSSWPVAASSFFYFSFNVTNERDRLDKVWVWVFSTDEDSLFFLFQGNNQGFFLIDKIFKSCPNFEFFGWNVKKKKKSIIYMKVK